MSRIDVIINGKWHSSLPSSVTAPGLRSALARSKAWQELDSTPGIQGVLFLAVSQCLPFMILFDSECCKVPDQEFVTFVQSI